MSALGPSRALPISTEPPLVLVVLELLLLVRPELRLLPNRSRRRSGACRSSWRRLLFADDCLQHVARLGDMRKIDLGLDLVAIAARTRRLAGYRRFTPAP